MGPQLFNSFKKKLEQNLQSIPDTPKMPGYTRERDKNSITSMIELLGKLTNKAEAE